MLRRDYLNQEPVSHFLGLFKINKRVISSVSAKTKPPCPVFRRIKLLARDLPIKQICLLYFVAIRLDTYVLVSADSFDFT